MFFKLVGPWTKPTRMEQSAGRHTADILETLLALILLTSGAWMARGNYLRGRSDIRGTVRLMSVTFAIEIAIWICRAHFIPTLATFGRFVLALSTGVFISAAMGMLYLALEPYVRRYWPQAIVSWSRLMAGRVRDSLVARDVLFGVARNGLVSRAQRCLSVAGTARFRFRVAQPGPSRRRSADARLVATQCCAIDSGNPGIFFHCLLASCFATE